MARGREDERKREKRYFTDHSKKENIKTKNLTKN